VTETTGPGAPTVLAVKDLTVSFPTEDGLVKAVRGVSFSVREGDVLGIVGESGSGKSVTCLAMLGLVPKSAKITGSAMFRGQELVGMKDKELRKLRGRRISMIFQDPMTSLNPVQTIGAQIAEAIWVHGELGKKDARERAVELLDIVGIPNPGERAKSYPHEFSGGMRQRAMIAMAISNDPDVLIADEPTTALDVTVQAQILETMERIRERTRAAIVFITHDLGVIAGIAERMVVMYAGKVVENGRVDEIYRQPRMPYTVGLLGSVPSVTGRTGRLRPIPGAPPSMVNLADGCPFSPRCPLAETACQAFEPQLQDVGINHGAACFRTDDVTRTLFDPAVVA
jgi:peptide/nickel transport system ATP-binding protein